MYLQPFLINWGLSPTPSQLGRGGGGEVERPQFIITLNICKTKYKYFIIQFYTKQTYIYSKMKYY